MLEPGTGVIDWLLGLVGMHSPGFGGPAIVVGLSFIFVPLSVVLINSFNNSKTFS